ncbi:MAG TPA: carboxypeptidase-like regulatory domain-containing protein [Ignavibacteria bacterium]|nr:carboxypeptidase-like regulatory domain-containing protein [Ignavibacteria bacterium]
MKNNFRFIIVYIFLLALVFPYGQVSAQTTPLTIKVVGFDVNNNSEPISGATVTLNGAGFLQTGVEGILIYDHNYKKDQVITIAVDAKGYLPKSVTITGETSEVTIALEKKQANDIPLIVQVVDKNTKPLAGARIYIEQNTMGVTTDNNGEGYILLNVSDLNKKITVEVSKEGYKTAFSTIPSELLQPSQEARLYTVFLVKKRDLVGLSGTWKSGWGDVTLNITDASVTGSWKQDSEKTGQITEGSFDEDTGVMRFKYSQPWNNATGTTEFTLFESDTEYTFSGTWQHDGGGGGTWTLTKAR